MEQETQNNDKKENDRGRGIYVLPNLFTIGALFAGFYAIITSSAGHYDNAAIAIFVAMLMDYLDGRVARLTNTVTPFGAELDSLSDMVNFGVAPSLVVYSFALNNLGKLGWLAAFVFTAAVALRLARFNTQINKSKRYFQGLSCTAAAGVMAGVVWATKELDVPGHRINILVAIITISLAILMVSNIRYRSFKDLDFKKHVPFVVILFIVLIFVFISIDPAKVLCSMFVLYALSGPFMTILELRKKKKERRLNLENHRASVLSSKTLNSKEEENKDGNNQE